MEFPPVLKVPPLKYDLLEYVWTEMFLTDKTRSNLWLIEPTLSCFIFYCGGFSSVSTVSPV